MDNFFNLFSDEVDENIEDKQKKPVYLFDFIKFLTYNKTSWDKLTDEYQMAFRSNVYSINRAISMNPSWINIANEAQILASNTKIPDATLYTYYYKKLPSKFVRLNYIKSKNKCYNDIFMKYARKYFCDNDHTILHKLKVLFKINDPKNVIRHIMNFYGADDKDIKKAIKEMV